MLTVFLTAFSESDDTARGAPIAFNDGSEGVETACCDLVGDGGKAGRDGRETVRTASFEGVKAGEGRRVPLAVGRDLRAFCSLGNGGRADVGGSKGGREDGAKDGRGSVVMAMFFVIVVVDVEDIDSYI